MEIPPQIPLVHVAHDYFFEPFPILGAHRGGLVKHSFFFSNPRALHSEFS